MNKRLVLMSAAAAVLGAYVLVGEGGWLSGLLQTSTPVGSPASQPGALQDTGVAAGKPRDGIKLNPLQGLEAQAFPAIVEQPLFNPGRLPRPPAPAPAPEPEPAAAPEPEPVAEDPGPVAADYRLLAVSSGPSGQVAALRLNQTNEVVYVRAGQDVQQWKVLTLGPRSIVIGTPEQNVEISMFDNTAAPSDVLPGEEGQSPDMPLPNAEPNDPAPEPGN